MQRGENVAASGFGDSGVGSSKTPEKWAEAATSARYHIVLDHRKDYGRSANGEIWQTNATSCRCSAIVSDSSTRTRGFSYSLVTRRVHAARAGELLGRQRVAADCGELLRDTGSERLSGGSRAEANVIFESISSLQNPRQTSRPLRDGAIGIASGFLIGDTGVVAVAGGAPERTACPRARTTGTGACRARRRGGVRGVTTVFENDLSRSTRGSCVAAAEMVRESRRRRHRFISSSWRSKPGNLGNVTHGDTAGVAAVIVCDRCTDCLANVVRASIGTAVPIAEATTDELLRG